MIVHTLNEFLIYCNPIMIMVILLHFGLHVLIASVLNAKLKGDFMVMLNLSATPVAKNHQAEIAILSLRLYASVNNQMLHSNFETG